MFENKIELNSDKRVLVARIRVDDNEWLGKSLTNVEIRDCTVTLYCTDGHILIVPANDLIIEVLPFENIKEDRSNIKTTIFGDENIDMVVEKNAEDK